MFMRLEKENDEGAKITFLVDNQPWEGRDGDTIASALYAGGRRAWRPGKGGDARGLLCGMGICFDCQVTVDSVPGVRACQVQIRPGMVVETGIAGEGTGESI
jgi:hypothetical protein